MALVLVLLAVFAATAAIAQSSRPGGVTNSQWAAYTGDLPRTWHGLFSRYGSNAELVVETRASSMYVVADQGREVRRKNVYSNREFFNITESVLVQRQENLAARTQPVILKDGNSFFNVRGPDAAKFLFFMVIMHPTDRSVRYSLVPVFVQGKFNRITLLRDVDVLRSRAGHFWKFGRRATTVTK